MANDVSDRVGVKEKPRGGQWVWRLVLYKEIENISTYTEVMGARLSLWNKELEI